MSTHMPLAEHMNEEMQRLRGKWCWFLLLGSLLIVIGIMAIGSPVVATLRTVQVFGILLLVAAGVQIASGIWGRSWGGFFMHLLCGLLYLFFGVMIIERPGLGAAGYTMLLAVFFVALGLSRVFFSLGHRFPGRGWALVSGVITLALGIMIWRNMPEASFFIIGTFVGIELIACGLSWFMLGLSLKSLPAGNATVQHP